MRYHKARRKELLERLEWKAEYDRAPSAHEKLPILWLRAGYALQLALLELGMLHDLYYANFQMCRALAIVRHSLSFIRAALNEMEKSIKAYRYDRYGYNYKRLIKIDHIRLHTPQKSNEEIQEEWREADEEEQLKPHVKKRLIERDGQVDQDMPLREEKIPVIHMIEENDPFYGAG